MGPRTARPISEIASSGAEILSREDGQIESGDEVIFLDQEGPVLLVAADAAQLVEIASVLDVAWIENYVLREKHNETAAGNSIGALAANASGYNGSSQIVAVADTGLGGGTAATAHADIPASRVVAILQLAWSNRFLLPEHHDDGAIDVDSGHGTHVARRCSGTVTRTASAKARPRAARLVFQATENWVTTSNLQA